MILNHLFFMIAGILAFLQVAFIPGWIIIDFLKIGGPAPRKLTMGFGLSLISNYWIIFILGSFHMYTIVALLSLIAIEAIALAFIYRAELVIAMNKGLNDVSGSMINCFKKLADNICLWLREEFSDEKTNYIKGAILISTIATFAYVLYLFVNNIGTIFKLSDAILSWNNWAVAWSNNILPKNTWEYPQLIPINWSIFYVMVGVPLEYLSKMIMPLFPLAIITTFAFTGVKKRSWGYIAAIPATVILTRVMVGYELMATEGYVDTALAFFGLFSILSLFWSDKTATKNELAKDILIGALFACGAAMTKQGGLYIIIIYPILAWFLIIKDNKELRATIWRYLIAYIGLIILLVGPFYIYKELAISAQGDVSVVPTIANLIYGGGQSPFMVSMRALYFLIVKTDGLIPIFAILLLFALRNKNYRYIAIFITIPYTIIWSVFNSYDTRNTALALPFWGLAAGIGVEQLLMLRDNFASRLLPKLKMKFVLVIALLLALAISPSIFGKITAKFNQDKRLMVDTELSVLLNNYFDNNKDGGKIFTDYGYLYFFPQFKDRIYSPYGGLSNNKNDFDEYYKDATSSEAAYIFSANYTRKDIADDLEAKIASGRFALIFRHDGFTLVKTNNK